jgi:hypothetical protein
MPLAVLSVAMKRPLTAALLVLAPVLAKRSKCVDGISSIATSEAVCLAQAQHKCLPCDAKLLLKTKLEYEEAFVLHHVMHSTLHLEPLVLIRTEKVFKHVHMCLKYAVHGTHQ